MHTSLLCSTGENGRAVNGLDKDKCELFEDERKQGIHHLSCDDAPTPTGLVFDTGGSMKDKPSSAKVAVKTFLDFANTEDEVLKALFRMAMIITVWTQCVPSYRPIIPTKDGKSHRISVKVLMQGAVLDCLSTRKVGTTLLLIREVSRRESQKPRITQNVLYPVNGPYLL